MGYPYSGLLIHGYSGYSVGTRQHRSGAIPPWELRLGYSWSWSSAKFTTQLHFIPTLTCFPHLCPSISQKHSTIKSLAQEYPSHAIFWEIHTKTISNISVPRKQILRMGRQNLVTPRWLANHYLQIGCWYSPESFDNTVVIHCGELRWDTGKREQKTDLCSISGI